MSKVLVFHDGTTAEFTDESTATDLITVCETYAEIDALRSKFTEYNLIGATFNDKLLVALIPVSCSASASVNGNIIVHFFNRFKSEIEIMRDEQESQAETIDYILMNM
jgi:hypothetical protein